ncbi:MAG: ATP-binding protein [Victivallales bacterium]|nr:ATP-binding protein [Victivallales bacterium]
MLKRKIEGILERFHSDPSRKALLLTGARQVGKTFSVREFAKSHYDVFVEFNLIRDAGARAVFEKADDARDVLLRISAMARKRLVPGKTLIFLDEVQACPEAVTFIKFLVEEGSYRYILSGSLLGVELRNIRSVPVGYMDEAEMFPLDFEEFLWANGVGDDVLEHLMDCFENLRTPDLFIHSRMMKYHSLYLITGGMPAVVQRYIDTNDLRQVFDEQTSIIREYRRDVTQYDERMRMRLRHIYSLIPSELNKHNKRFHLNNATARGRFERLEDDFVWLKEAGVAIPVFNVDEPKVPLELARKANLFKLFLNDVGLLCAFYMDGIQLRILNGETDMNFGSVFENYVAQELAAHGYGNIYYYSSKKHGEVDFLVERNGNVLPLEVKSGRSFKAHAALDNLMSERAFAIPRAWVLSGNGEVIKEGSVIYMPVYFMMFLKRDAFDKPLIYKVE